MTVASLASAGLLLVVAMTLSVANAGGFDWGDQCSAGRGSFELVLPTERGTETVGTIPTGKEGVEVSLSAENDIDVTLFDLDETSVFPEGRAIVAWCNSADKADPTKNCGVLGGKELENATYKGMSIQYSGYNGVDGRKGNEFITILGATTVSLEMRVFAFKTGQAAVDYAWAASTSDCCRSVYRACGGSFEAVIGEKELVAIGSIPTDKGDLRVELVSDVDVDVQLYDTDYTRQFDNGAAIVAWCNSKDKLNTTKNCGVLGGKEEERAFYERLTYIYSGYNGVRGEKGNEFIEIDGVTNRNLMMYFYGYKAGAATVSYSYTQPPPLLVRCSTFLRERDCDATSHCEYRGRECQDKV